MFGYGGSRSFTQGNSVSLLNDGEEFFARLIRRIRAARHEIFIETFILEHDRVGGLLQRALIKAAKRGVWIAVTVDSYGSFFLDDDYIQTLTDAGVVFQIYDPQPQILKGRPMVFRRLHRKLAVVDGEFAFVGGINLFDEHLTSRNPGGKRDFAVELVGPVSMEVRELCRSYVRDGDDSHLAPALPQLRRREWRGPTEVAFVARDNKHNRTEIEKAYLAGIRAAKKRIVIANAYFFPGFRMMRALRRAAKRGVEVSLILQGNPDIPFALKAARCLYDRMCDAKIKVYEYTDRPLHAKIAVIDDDWATVGSSNLDPWSLSLNLEANVFIRDQHFNEVLSKHLNDLMAVSRLIEADWVQARAWYTQLQSTMTYHVLRRLPNLITWLPHHRPKIRRMETRFATAQGSSRDRGLRRAYPESKNARRILFKQDYHDVSGI